MRTAFKEWAVAIDALARGEQIFILRKGGIHEARGGFKVEHPEFLLFPTLFHQQRESVVPTAQARFDAIAPNFPPAGRIRFTHWARVAEWLEIRSPEALEALRGQHIWTDAILRERFEWGKSKSIFALAIRVFELPQAVELADSPSYGGCKSWLALEEEIETAGSRAVLNDSEFAARLERFREALQHPA